MEKTKTEINCTTGEEITRKFTIEELAQTKLDKAENAKQNAEAEAKATERQLILDKLGLTADEARLLLG